MISKISRALFFMVFLSGVVISFGASAARQDEETRFFEETGHSISGEFLKLYDSVPNAILVFGYPLTEAFPLEGSDSNTGILVQYFERARFELRPNALIELPVTISPLGSYLYELEERGDALALPANYPGCQTFDLNDFQVCYAFLDFFNANGGISQFGYPISNIEIHEGLMVQYFQRARFEWHPEFDSGKRVLLTDVGRIYFQLNEDPGRLRPIQDPDASSALLVPPLALNVQAFVSQAVVASEGEQTLYVTVQNQNMTPLADAQVTFVLTQPSGEQTRLIMPATDAHGVTFRSFPLTPQPVGVAEIRITVLYQNLRQETVTSYRIWW